MKPGTSRIQIRSVATRLSLFIAKLFVNILVLWATLTSQDPNKGLVALPGRVLNVQCMGTKMFQTDTKSNFRLSLTFNHSFLECLTRHICQ